MNKKEVDLSISSNPSELILLLIIEIMALLQKLSKLYPKIIIVIYNYQIMALQIFKLKLGNL